MAKDKNPFKRTKRTPSTTSGRGSVLVGKSRPTKNEKLNCYIGYLNGLDDADLIIIGNTTPATLEKWKIEFNNDKTTSLMKLRHTSLELVVTDTELKEHAVYIENLRLLKEQHETELSMLKSIVNALNTALEKLNEHLDFDSTDFKQCCAMLKSFSSAKTSRSALQADYIKVCNQLNNETGLVSYHKAAGNKVNEIAKAEGRLEIARKRKEEGLETSTELKKKGFFDVK